MAAQEQKPGRKATESVVYPVCYMFVLCLVAASVLVVLQRATAARVDANRRILFEAAVLAAVGIDLHGDDSPGRVHRVFTERMAPPTETTAGAWRLIENGRVAAYALPVEGRGFWDMVRGVIGISADGRSVTGLAFHEQHETPGLGAEIAQPDFRRRFPGVKLLGGAHALRFRPPGATLGEGEIHAVTGATRTCTRLETLLNQGLGRWRRAMGFVPAAGPADEGATP